MNVLQEQVGRLPLIEREFGGRTVVVTGAASGIGTALTRRLSAVAGSLHLIDKNPIGELPRNNNSYQIDIALMREALVDFGEQIPPVDMLVLAAGVTQKDSTASLSPEEQLAEEQRVFSVNFEGTRNVFESVRDKLKPGATVVIVSSDLGIRGDERLSIYAASKKKLIGWGQEMARKYQDIRFVIVAPGPVDTPLFRYGKSPETIERIENAVGIMKPEECAEDILNVAVNKEEFPSGVIVTIYKRGGIQKVTT